MVERITENRADRIPADLLHRLGARPRLRAAVGRPEFSPHGLVVSAPGPGSVALFFARSSLLQGPGPLVPHVSFCQVIGVGLAGEA